MSKNAKYHEFPDMYEDNIEIKSISSDILGVYIVLDNSIFYPQGGGQASDRGYIEIGSHLLQVTLVKSICGEVRHYIDIAEKISGIEGKIAGLMVDREVRFKNSRLHTAGHLISNIVESIYPEFTAIKGHHFPGECYVEFSAKRIINNINLDDINEKINSIIDSEILLRTDNIGTKQLEEICPNLPYKIPLTNNVRIIAIDSFPFQPCGGTHVSNTKYLQNLRSIKTKMKKNKLKIYYEIT